MTDTDLLKIFSYRENLENYLYLIDTKYLSIQSIEIIKAYQEYFKTYLEEAEIDWSKFISLFFISLHPNFNETQIELYTTILNQVQKLNIDSKHVTKIIGAFKKQILYRELEESLAKNAEIEKIQTKIDKFNNQIVQLNDLESFDIEMSLDRALQYTDRGEGLKFRLNSLKDHFSGGLIKGDFIVVAGYVDSGKSSFCASEVSYMAQQLTGDDYILWLNTEGTWEQVVIRLYCATLGCTREDLKNWTNDAKMKYNKEMGGNSERIKVLNYHNKTIYDVERLIKKHPPKLIVFDLLDHIKGIKQDDSVEKYGELYQWGRTIATNVCPVIAISQLNRNGNDSMYPPMTELSGSGEKKQGAATALILIGSIEGNDTERFLSTPKNKIGGGKGFRCSVKFDPLKARFSD